LIDTVDGFGVKFHAPARYVNQPRFRDWQCQVRSTNFSSGWQCRRKLKFVLLANCLIFLFGANAAFGAGLFDDFA
jgi:hypothetical protein